MGIWEFAAALVLAIAGGAAGAAAINGLNERWKFKASRRAHREDREEERADRTEEISKEVKAFEQEEREKNQEIDRKIEKMGEEIAAQSEALKLILLDRILWLGQSYISKGEISFDDRRRFHAMHDCYHEGLHGNGDADIIVEGVDSLPLKQ